MEIAQVSSAIYIKKDNWSVDFRMSPAASIIVSGDKPGLNEFRDTLSSTMMPLPTIDALWIAACVAFDTKEAKDGAND